MEKILVTGASGQIGSELTPTLRNRYGTDAVIASDIGESSDIEPPFEPIDVTNEGRLSEVVEEYDVDTIFHLAALLSATGEKHPQKAYEVNIDGLRTVLEIGRNHDLDEIVVPSSIAVFGEETPPSPSERTVLCPNTIYGVSKAFGEQLGEYYHQKYGLDVRGVRLPGIISHKTRPGGGTTDYAVEVFYEAIENGSYTYFVREDTKLPMMYMPDAINALVGIAEADSSALTYRCSYNVGASGFTAEELTAAIQEHLPEFEAQYEPDERQAIADSWPAEVDDSAAREDWGWDHTFDLDMMVEDMIANLTR